LPLEGCLVESRLRRGMTHVEAMRDAFVPFSGVTIPQRMGGLLLQRQLSHLLDTLGRLGAPVTVGPLEIGGSSDAAAAQNLETLLRLLFATESVRGVYFGGFTVADVADPAAALLDDAGRPLRPGAVVEGLFDGVWRT